MVATRLIRPTRAMNVREPSSCKWRQVLVANDNAMGTIEQEIQSYRDDPEFIADGWALGIAEEVAVILKREGKTQTWLADEMHVSRSHVSSILSAPPNMTLLTLAKLKVALGVEAVAGLNIVGHRIDEPCPAQWHYDHEDWATDYAILQSGRSASERIITLGTTEDYGTARSHASS